MRPHNETPSSYANLSSLTTSRVDGMASPVPGTGRRSNRETAKDRAAEQARVGLHLRNHAASTLPWRRCGADCALALARADKNCAVSTLQRPRTSAAIQPGVPDHLRRTAPGTWPPSFFSPSAVQLRRGWRPLLKRTRRARGETNVVSIASCAPRQKLEPSATTSNLRPSKALNSLRSMSLTHTFVATRAPASRPICAAARGNLLFPQHPCLCTRCAMVAKHV